MGKYVDLAVDVAKLSEAVASFAQGAVAAQNAGWWTAERAAEAWAKLMAEFGVEYDYADEYTEVEEEEESPGPTNGQGVGADTVQQWRM